MSRTTSSTSTPRGSSAAPASPSPARRPAGGVAAPGPTSPSTGTAPRSAKPRASATGSTPAGGAGPKPSPSRSKVAAAAASSSPSKGRVVDGVGAEPAVAAAVTPANEERVDGDGSGQTPKDLVFFDIDNTLYSAKLGIAQLMSVRIQAFFRDHLGLPPEEAQELHHKYYKEYGLAVRGLVRHHSIDPLEYDRLCDQSLPLDTVLQPDERLKELLARFDRSKCRVIAVTNAYKIHAHRVLNCLEIAHYFEDVIYCDYSQPNFACKPEKEYFDAALAAVSQLDVSTFRVPPPPHDRIGRTFFVDDSALNCKASRDVCQWHSVVHFKEVLDDGTDVVAAGALALPNTSKAQDGDAKGDALALTSSNTTSKVNLDEASASATGAAHESDANKARASAVAAESQKTKQQPEVGAPPRPTALDISLLQKAASSSPLALQRVSNADPADAARTQLLKQLVRLSPDVRLELFRALLDSTPSSFLPPALAKPATSTDAEEKGAKDGQNELDAFQAELDMRRTADEEARARAERRRRLALYGGLWGAMDNVPRKVIVKVLGMLHVEDLLVCRRVSKKWHALTYLPELWASHARELMQNDPGGPPVGDPMAMTLGLDLALPGTGTPKKGKTQGLGLALDNGPTTAESRTPTQEDQPVEVAKVDSTIDPATLPRDEAGQLLPSEWELLVKKLVRRERNWAKGVAQKVQYMEGHTGFVTSMKLKGRKTLVTGSYDETIRVWDMHTGACTKVLKAKAIACLDFLLPSADGSSGAILCAGLYDTGRVMVWDMKNWTLLQTLSGHNRGIRNVALSEDVLVSVGQDKAIVVWDWRTGTKLLKFGQQSNVSLGTSIVDKDKIVAVTVDGIIRTFCIRRKEMIGQFDLSKLGGVDKALSAQLAGIGGDGMLQWFAAHGNSMTVAAKNLVVHLEWTEHVVPIEDHPVPLTRGSGASTFGKNVSSGLSSSNSLRSSIGAGMSTPTRTRKDSTQTTATSSSRPASRASLSPLQSTSNLRPRHDSTASSTTSTVLSSSTSSSSARTVAAGGVRPGSSTGGLAAGRKSMPLASANGTTVRSPERRNGTAGSGHRTTLSTSTNSRPGTSTPTADRRKSLHLSSSMTSPTLSGSGRPPPLSPSSGFRFPTSSTDSTLNPLSPNGGSHLELPASATEAPSKPVRTRIAPNLEVAPRVVSILRTPDISTGCMDPAKRRVVCSTRFSSRSGADRRLYASTYSVRTGVASGASAGNGKEAQEVKGSGEQRVGVDDGSAAPNANDGSMDDQNKTPTSATDGSAAMATLTKAGPGPSSTADMGPEQDRSSSVVPIRGAWKAEADKLSQPSRNPMAMILDHESCVVGCQDGTVYKLSFVGDEYDDAPEPEDEDGSNNAQGAGELKPFLPHLTDKDEASAGHVTISDLSELEHVWEELMLPAEAPADHPGRWRPPVPSADTALEQLGFK